VLVSWGGLRASAGFPQSGAAGCCAGSERGAWWPGRAGTVSSEPEAHRALALLRSGVAAAAGWSRLSRDAMAL